MYRNYFADLCGNKYPAPRLLIVHDVILLSGSDQTKSPIGPDYGIYWIRFIVAMLSSNGVLGDSPPCTHIILSTLYQNIYLAQQQLMADTEKPLQYNAMAIYFHISSTLNHKTHKFL